MVLALLAAVGDGKFVKISNGIYTKSAIKTSIKLIFGGLNNSTQ